MNQDAAGPVDREGPDWAVAVVDAPAPTQRQLLHVIWRSRTSTLVERAVTHPAMNDRTLIWAAIGDHLQTHSSVIAFCERPSVLRHWSASPDSEIRRLVAFNTATPPDVAQLLLADANADVRANAPYHPAIAESDLVRLASADPRGRLRYAADDALNTEFGRALRSGQRWAYLTESEEIFE